jgi:hypothetical protein
MKKYFAIAMLVLGGSLSSQAWNCTTPGQIRIQVPTGTVGNGTGDGSGQVVVDSGLTFICEALPTAPATTPSTATSTSNSTSGANATSGSSSSANASGGNATANGGTSSSKSGVSNSGNSNVKVSNSLANTNNLGQTQTQSNSSVNSNQSAGGSASNIGNSVTNVAAPEIPANTAVAPPVFSTANCFKGMSVAGQAGIGGISFGGGKIDSNCAAERIAQDYFAMGNRLAACKVITSTKASKDAGVTMADCMNVPVPVVRTVVPIVSTPAPAPIKVEITNNIPPAPAPIILHEEMTVTAPRPQAKKRVVHKPCPVTEIQNQCAVKTQEK